MCSFNVWGAYCMLSAWLGWGGRTRKTITEKDGGTAMSHLVKASGCLSCLATLHCSLQVTGNHTSVTMVVTVFHVLNKVR